MVISQFYLSFFYLLKYFYRNSPLSTIWLSGDIVSRRQTRSMFEFFTLFNNHQNEESDLWHPPQKVAN